MQYKWIALTNTTICILMASLDANILIIALPRLVPDLHVSLIETIWIILSYGLVTSSVLLSFGRLADMFGRVKLYNFGLILFTIASFLCSLAQTGTELILFRILQAFGAAFLFSNSAAILTDAFDEKERGKALGLNQISIVIGSALGLVLGGILTEMLGWRAIFWVNIPIGIFAIVWSKAKLRELGTIVKGKIDWIGNLVLVVGLVMVMLGITFGSLQVIPSFAAMFLLAGGFCMLLLFGYVESKVKEPMFDLSLFKLRFFSAGNITIFLNALARGALVLIMAFYLQGPSMRLNPFTAGLYLIPVSFTIATFGPISGWLSDRYGSRFLTILGLLVSAIGFLMLSQIGPVTSFNDLVLPLSLVGAGMGLFASPNRSSIMNSVPPQRRGVAAGMSTTLVTLGNIISLGVSFALLASTVPLYELESIFLGSSSTLNAGAAIPSFIKSIHLIFYISTFVLIASIIPAIVQRSQKERVIY
ncbi:MAG: MFS transporter [Thaumarchaeota archaeon]|nr:MFS transporter [Nitrososphaerota archaeon]MDE1817317.1 MFS transporter [Nitrososphaerota archaeon]MDE1875446.1 MFS transporter [Nitrososphaerota archaeon]